MNARKFGMVALIAGAMVTALFWISRKMQKSNRADEERLAILEKAREAKLAKSILKKEQENEE